MKRLKKYFMLSGLALVSGACTKNTENVAEVSNTAQVSEQNTGSATQGEAVNLKEGVQVIDMVVGSGDLAVAGKQVQVHYTGWLENKSATDGKGTKFDSSLDRGQPFVFPLGAGRVIRGWDVGVEGMKVGGKRKLVIPADKAYGNQDVGGGLIPAGSTLVFEVELLGVGA